MTCVLMAQVIELTPGPFGCTERHIPLLERQDLLD